MTRDRILDDALAAVRGQAAGSDLIGDVLVQMPIEELRRFAGRLAILATWAIEIDSLDDLAAMVDLIQRHGSRP